jgi:hypothetical protein
LPLTNRVVNFGIVNRLIIIGTLYISGILINHLKFKIMKNIVLILAFVFISLSGFSQTFTLSSYTSGQIEQSYNVSSGHGYSYSYTMNAMNSCVMIVSQHDGMLAMLNNYSPIQQQSTGFDYVGPYLYTQTDVIWLIISNGTSYCYGYAQVSVDVY